MSKHSFAPKINAVEEQALAFFSMDEYTEDYSAVAARLMVRGLLQAKSWQGGEYRRTKRGTLMLQRAQRDRRIRELKSEFQGVAYRDLPS